MELWLLEMHKRGQIFSTDLIISATIFIILISFIFFIFTRYQAKLNENINSNDIGIKAIQISDLIVQSNGDPSNWEKDSSKINTIGLVSNDRKISGSKVLEFIKLNYNTTRDKFNIRSFDFYFILKELNSASTSINGTIIKSGKFPNSAAKNIITIKRLVLYGQNEKVMEFTLWK